MNPSRVGQRGVWIWVAIINSLPFVLGPAQVPEIADDAVAPESPELAVLSAMAHGRDADDERAIEIAMAAQGASIGLDPVGVEIQNRVAQLSVPELSAIGKQLLSAPTLEDALR